jgi:hypothetical protein
VANIIFTRQFGDHYSGANWTSGVYRCLLERDTSTYTPNKDHDFVSDLTGLVEISVAGYARQTLTGCAVVYDDANDRVELDCDNISFGNLPSGQTVKAFIIYRQTGGSDATPADDPLFVRFDTATGLPAVLGGGAFTITIDVEGLQQLSQP